MGQPNSFTDKVRQVRNTLLAKNDIASVEAVHKALGCVGSKAAIRRSLKKLTAQDSRKYARDYISGGLQTVVTQLVERIGEEMQRRIDILEQEHRKTVQTYQEAVVTVAETADNLRYELQQRERALHDMTQACKANKEALHREMKERQKAERQAAELKGILAETTAGYLALEQKFPDISETLNHYRLIANEEHGREQQRLLDEINILRDDNQQLRQMLDEQNKNYNYLSQEMAQLESDLHYAREVLQQASENGPESAQANQHNNGIAELINEKDAQLERAQEQFSRTHASQKEIIGRMLRLEMELAGARSALREQQELTAQYQAFLALRGLKLGG